VIGIAFNLGLLAYFKYAHFFVDNINILLKTQMTLNEIILPLGISFFTFTQIAFLVDTYKNKTDNAPLLDYCLFVSFFPHLLAGPIIHHKQIMPQFRDEKLAYINYQNIYFGLVLFILGLLKKVIVADTFATVANLGFNNTDHLTLISAWTTSLSYTFQIYFDFSGYTDMSLGAAKLFNINLPLNFNSPYQSLNIREFWQRWHITLSQFLRDYLYIPMGGNRTSEIYIYRNLIITFLLGGFWHGAGFTFIFWGFLHGLGLSTTRYFKKFTLKYIGRMVEMPKFLAWFMTFNFINITWIFFRAGSITDAFKIVKSMFALTDFFEKTAIENINALKVSVFLLFFGFMMTLKIPSSFKMVAGEVLTSSKYLPLIALVFTCSIIVMEITNSHEFIYFRF
jgi:D-alanyl-lipoteichoic acid acyltransferase DltB (MBOAT superfamily)